MAYNIDNIKEFLKKSFVFVLAFILLFEISPIKDAITNIFKFAESNNILVGLNLLDISQIYYIAKKYSLIYLIICSMCFLPIHIYSKIRNYLSNPKNHELNSFENSLYKYIEDKPYGKGYLITGEWGSGKTHIVTEFFNKHYRFSNKPIFRISCFGLDSRKLILDEIKHQFEINDKSLLNWIQYIPAIGKPIFNVLMGSYSLNSIPKGSIFIFDDFERITSLGITENHQIKSYKKDPFMLRNNFGTKNEFKEFKDINNEFTKIEGSLRRIEIEGELKFISDNLQKYNIATGLINELIENYNLKVIIICNVDVLGFEYLDKIFRGKLDCITYNKSIDENSIESIFENTFKNQIFSNKDIEQLINSCSETLIDDFKKVWLTSGNNNLRQAKSIIQAFLDTVNIINSTVALNENYLRSLFFSIYVVRVLRDENSLENLDSFLVGGNLAFYLKLYDKHGLYNSLKSSDSFYNLKWTGLSIAGFWILNLDKIMNMSTLLEYYSSYEYNDLEIALLQLDYDNFNDRKILMEHVAYIIKEETHTNREQSNNQLDEIGKKARNGIGIILGLGQNDDVSIEVKVHDLLIKIDTMLSGSYYSSYLEEWYKSIYLYSKVESVIDEKNSYILRNYNEFVNKFSDSVESPIE